MGILSRRLANNASNPSFLTLTDARKTTQVEEKVGQRIEGYIKAALRECEKQKNANGKRKRRPEGWYNAADALRSWLKDESQARFDIFSHGTFYCEGRFGQPSCAYGHVGNIYWCEEDFIGFDCWQLDHQIDQQYIREGVELAMETHFDHIAHLYVERAEADWIDAISNFINIHTIAHHCFGRFDAAHPDAGGLKVVFKVCHDTSEHIHAPPDYSL